MAGKKIKFCCSRNLEKFYELTRDFAVFKIFIEFQLMVLCSFDKMQYLYKVQYLT